MAAEQVTIALAGDTMLGRRVAAELERRPPETLFAPEVVEIAREADLMVVGLECCISERGDPWPAPGKPFFFRAPPRSLQALVRLGVSCVTLANNHALDYGAVALDDTLDHLFDHEIAAVGAGPDVATARRPAVLEAAGVRVAVVALTDHPADFAAGRDAPGVAYADLRRAVPDWVIDTITEARAVADIVLVSPHWGPNMVSRPVPHVLRSAEVLTGAGATVVAGHSAHVFHGVSGRVLYDLGDFIDDYAVDPVLRNDLGLLWLITVDASGPSRLEVVPLVLELAHTRLAAGEERGWIVDRFRSACAEFGTPVEELDDRLVVTW